MMKLTMRQVVESRLALQRLAEQRFPVKLSYKLGRVVSGVSRELERFERHRLDLIKTHGEEIAEGQWRIDQKSASFQAFSEEFEELLSIEVEVWGDPVKLDELEGKEITPADIAALSWLFEAEEDN